MGNKLQIYHGNYETLVRERVGFPRLTEKQRKTTGQLERALNRICRFILIQSVPNELPVQERLYFTGNAEQIDRKTNNSEPFSMGRIMSVPRGESRIY